MGRLATALLLSLATTPGLAQQAPTEKPNELVAGKLIYVAPMPDDLDQWILDFLRRWGKYKATGNPEGVDLAIKAVSPEEETKWKTSRGVVVPKKQPKQPLVVSVSVIDWVTNQPLWNADILNRKQKKDEPDPPAGPHTQIFARDMTPDQLAQKLTARLREYVGQLEKNPGGKVESEGKKQP